MPSLATSQAIRQCTGGLAAVGISLGHFAAFVLAASFPALTKVPACAISAILFVEFAPLLADMPKDVRYLCMQMKLNSGDEGRLSWRAFLASDLAIYLAAAVSPLLFGVIQGSVLAI